MRLAQEIEKVFPEVEVSGNSKGSPRIGAFEITDDAGNTFWRYLTITLFLTFISKLSGKGFPSSPSVIIDAMKEKGYK
jgi:hypothetical protein